jgi:NitT/TauT family transport system permease protein
MAWILFALLFAAGSLWGNHRLARRSEDRFGRIAAPLLFGLAVVVLWEGLVRGLEVPGVILPPPTVILTRFGASLDILWVDFVQTFVKGMLSGYFLGCGAAVLIAILIDRSPFLQRGLLPLGNLVAVLPIVGTAPILVMWFGFDWQSKAAVVVAVVFFPMLVNTLEGLRSSDRIQRELLQTYGACGSPRPFP